MVANFYQKNLIVLDSYFDWGQFVMEENKNSQRTQSFSPYSWVDAKLPQKIFIYPWCLVLLTLYIALRLILLLINHVIPLL